MDAPKLTLLSNTEGQYRNKRIEKEKKVKLQAGQCACSVSDKGSDLQYNRGNGMMTGPCKMATSHTSFKPRIGDASILG